MPAPKKLVSKIWKHFTRFPESNGKNTECNICKHRFLYTSSTCNLWNHLQNKHGIINEESVYHKSAQGGEARNQDAINKMWKIGCQTKYLKGSTKYEDITHHLIKLIIQEYIPIEKVESEAFKNYSRMLDPRYEVPGRKYLDGVIACMYQNAQKNQKQKINCLQFVSLTTDTWTSDSNDGYITVTAHGISNDWELKEYIIHVKNIQQRHTAEYLSQELMEIAEMYSIEKPITITDSGANIKAAIKKSSWPRFPCAAHMINLAVKSGLEAKNPPIPLVQSVLEKCRAIVGHFRHSSVASANLKKAASVTNHSTTASTLVQEVPTRWNSCYDMLKRLLLLKCAVTSQLAMIDKQELYLSPEEWRMIEWLLQVLKPLKIISETLCGSKYPTMSIVYPSIRNLLDFALHEQKNPSPHPAVAQLKSKIRMKLEHDFRDSTSEDKMSTCTLIDPRFKYLVITNHNQKLFSSKFQFQVSISLLC